MNQTENQRPKKVMPISPGRPKGVQNKVNTALKEAILAAADAAGGEGGIVGYLTRQANENPAPFMGLLGKVLPTTLATDPGKPLEIVTNPVDRLREVIEGIASRGDA